MVSRNNLTHFSKGLVEDKMDLVEKLYLVQQKIKLNDDELQIMFFV